MQQGLLIPTIIVFAMISMFEIISTLIRRKLSKSCFYKFYEDRLVYRDTYFRKKAKEVDYKSFKEIRYNQGFIQSRFNIGEIYISTNSKNFFNRFLILKLIPDVEENYEKITKIFNT